MAKKQAELDLEGFLPYRLAVLSNVVSGTIADFYAERFGLSIPEWRVMAVLGRVSGLSAAEVAEKTAMDKVAVSRAVASLLKTGRIERRFASDDKRRSILELSEKGRDIYVAVAPEAVTYEKELLSTLTDEDKAALDRVLDKLWTQARAIKEDHERQKIKAA